MERLIVLRWSLMGRRMCLVSLAAGILWILPLCGVEGAELDQPLMQAAKSGALDKVESLLKDGADVNAKDEFGWTPLIWASKEGRTQVVKLLLEKGAKPNQANAWGWFPLTWAALHGHKDVVKLLLEHGADPRAKADHGWTALSLAAEMKHTDVVKLLENAGAVPATKTDASAPPERPKPVEKADRGKKSEAGRRPASP